jgi:predicted protein tyrosine phosphatase
MKSPGLVRFTTEFYQTFKELMQMVLNLFYEIERSTAKNTAMKAVLHSSQNQTNTQQQKRIIAHLFNELICKNPQ